MKSGTRMSVPVLLAVLLLPAGSLADTAEDRVIATWRDGSLTAQDYQSWRAVHGVDDGPAAVRELAYVLSMAQASRERGADRQPRTVLELEAMRQAILIPPLREALTADVEVTDAELQQLRAEHPEALRRPRKLKLRNIFFRLDPADAEARAATRERLASIRSRIVAGEDFGELAASLSESQSRFRRGQLGWVAPEKLPKPLAAAVSELGPGELSDLVEHAGGVGIYLCEEVRAESVKRFEDVRATWRASLLKRRKEDLWQELGRRWTEESHVKLGADAGGEADDPVALTMDGYRLAASDVDVLLEIRRPKRQPDSIGAEERDAVLRDWAFGVAAVQRAEQDGLHERPDLAPALRWRAVDVLARRELVRRVDERFREPTTKQLEELMAAKGSSPEFFKADESRLAMIHFGSVDDQEDPKAWLGEVQAVVRAMEAGELSFEDAARKYSVLPSASAGGDAGWLPLDRLVDLGPRFASALRVLKPGESSGLLRLESGLWVFELRGQRPSRPMTFEEAEPKLRQMARKKQISALEQAIRSEQLAAMDLVIADHPKSE